MPRKKKSRPEGTIFEGPSDTSLQCFLEKHRQQARTLEIFISDNLAKIDGTTRDHSWRQEDVKIVKKKLKNATCNEALDKMLELEVVSRDLLIEIRAEYEEFINVLSLGHFQFNSIQDEIKRSKTDPVSLILLQQRREQLEKRIEILKENSERIACQIQQMRDTAPGGGGGGGGVNNSHECDTDSKVNKISQLTPNRATNNLKPKSIENQKHLVLDKLSVPAATDIGKLVRYSAKLQNKIQKITESLNLQYAKKSKLEQLKNQLLKKENTQHHLLLYNTRLKERYENLRTASESFKDNDTYVSEKPQTMAGMVSKALEDHRKPSPDQFALHSFAATGIIEDDDPAKKREAEILMDYMDTFNEMMSAKEYEQAARHAANSPKGILRSFEIMKMFKEVDCTGNGKSPALLFCEALMSTAETAEKMSPGLCSEIMKCALKNGKLSLVSFWFSKKSFTYSLPLGNQLVEHCKCKEICKCGSLDLAKEVFESIGAYRQASLCLLLTGKIHSLIQYGKAHHFTVSDYVYLCKRSPSTKLLLFLMSGHTEDKIPGLISFPTAMNILLQSKNTTVLSEILEEIYANGLVAVNGKTRSIMDLMLAETSSDCMSRSKWDQIAEICCENSLDEIALELVSILAVRDAIDMASYKYLMDYIS